MTFMSWGNRLACRHLYKQLAISLLTSAPRSDRHLPSNLSFRTRVWKADINILCPECKIYPKTREFLTSKFKFSFFIIFLWAKPPLQIICPLNQVAPWEPDAFIYNITRCKVTSQDYTSSVRPIILLLWFIYPVEQVDDL